MAEFIAATSSGLESLLFEELKNLGVKRLKAHGTSIHFEGPWSLAYKVLHRSRLATRVLKPLLDFQAYNQDDIYNHVKKHNFLKYIEPHQTLRVDINGRSKIFKDARLVGLVIKDVVVDQFREEYSRRPSVDKLQPDLPLMARVGDEKINLSLDLSGKSLSHRGYRRQTVEAPLREHLASALLEFAEWKFDENLVDPMCGSGTLLFEAFLKAQSDNVHSLDSKFAYKNWKTYQRVALNDLQSQSDSTSVNLWGNDLSGETIKVAKETASSIGAKSIHWSQKSCLEFVVDQKPGLIVTNPPYGVRLDDLDSVAKLFTNWSNHLKKHFKGWRLAMISSDPILSKAMNMKASKKLSVKNGDLDCRFLLYEIL